MIKLTKAHRPVTVKNKAEHCFPHCSTESSILRSVQYNFVLGEQTLSKYDCAMVLITLLNVNSYTTNAQLDSRAVYLSIALYMYNLNTVSTLYYKALLAGP